MRPILLEACPNRFQVARADPRPDLLYLSQRNDRATPTRKEVLQRQSGRCFDELVFRSQGARHQGAHELNIYSIGRSRLRWVRFHSNDSSDFAGRDFIVERQFRLGPKTYCIPHPKAAQPRARALAVLIDKNDACDSRTRLRAASLSGVPAYFPVSKFAIVLRWIPDASAS